MKYSDCLTDWLLAAGYDTCFYLAGGNIMHLLESVSKKIRCIPVIHEVAGGIAAEYYTEIHKPQRKAFALVTAGPGLTNVITAMAGAYLESHSLLVIGGQVKVPDLNDGSLRQRGIQEIDGAAIARPTTKKSVVLKKPINADEFADLIAETEQGRPGPVFIEIPLDVQAAQVSFTDEFTPVTQQPSSQISGSVAEIIALLKQAKRPGILLGGGTSWATCQRVQNELQSLAMPIFTTWNAFDRLCASAPNYFGRPNTWGQRYSNILLQQCDLLIVLGSRLGMQQTGFNWKAFLQHGNIVQVDIDANELNKGHPVVKHKIQADANQVLSQLLSQPLPAFPEWLAYCTKVKSLLPLVEENNTGADYVSPHRIIEYISSVTSPQDIVIPCSSGGAFTVSMQTFRQKFGQRVITNKGLASMGYGLSGAIGAAIAEPEKRVILIEGDGGFAQNLQELGTVALNQLNLKIFIFYDEGYASIRMTQRNYFKGRYVGCDTKTGLGLPKYDALFTCYGIPCVNLKPGYETSAKVKELFEQKGPAGFIVHIDPEQTYFPKITSRVLEDGSMESNPLHLMTPELPPEIWKEVSLYL